MAEKIFIDIDEEIIFIIEKVREVSADRVILTVPDKAAFLGSVVSMQLLAKEVGKLKKLVILVSNDKIGARLSKKAGLVLVEKVSDITEQTWEKAANLADQMDRKLYKTKEELMKERKEPAKEAAKTDAGEKEKKSPSETITGKPKVVIIDGYELFAGGDVREFKHEKPFERNLNPSDDAHQLIPTPSPASSSADHPKEHDAHFSDRARDQDQGDDNAKLAGKGNDLIKSLKYNSGKFLQQLKRGGLAQKIGIALLALYIVSLFVFKSASLTVFVESQTVNATETVQANTSVSELNLNTLTIPATYLEQNADRSDSAAATEEIEVGEEAEGTIGVFNKTFNKITLPAGTVLVEKVHGLEYVTNLDVTIDKAVDTGSSIDFGYADIGVTAASFGENYNTGGENREYTVTGYTESQLSAKNFEDIKGGTTETATVVAQSDVDALKNQLIEQLKEDALGKLQSSTGDDVQVIPDTFSYEVINENISPAVGEAAENFSLSLTINGKVLSFKKSDLDPLAEIILSNDAKEDLDIEEYEYNPNVKSVEGDSVTIQLDITGVVTPTLDSDTLLNEVAGKSEGRAREILGSKSDINDFNLEVGPVWAPGFLRRLPGDSSDIEYNLRKI